MRAVGEERARIRNAVGVVDAFRELHSCGSARRSEGMGASQVQNGHGSTVEQDPARECLAPNGLLTTPTRHPV